MLLARSAPEGEADEIAMNPDIDTRKSAVGGKADVPATWPGSPLLATSGPCSRFRYDQGRRSLDPLNGKRAKLGKTKENRAIP